MTQIWPVLLQFWFAENSSSKVFQIWPDLDQNWPDLDETGAKLSRSEIELYEFNITSISFYGIKLHVKNEARVVDPFFSLETSER